MMTPLGRRTRTCVALWVGVAVVVWNGVYDLMMTRGVQEYLFQNALHQLGRGPDRPMKAFMDRAIYDAVWVSTIWAGVVLLAGLVTIKVLSRADLAP
jgi:hypothetical protein